MKKILMALLAVVALSGCTTVSVQPEIEQSSLMQYCGMDTPLPINYKINEKGEKVYDGKEFMRVLVEWQDYYNKCASMHDALVDTLKELQSQKKIPSKK